MSKSPRNRETAGLSIICDERRGVPDADGVAQHIAILKLGADFTENLDRTEG